MFFENPTKRFQLRELARLSGISTTGIKSALLDLLGARIITKTKEKNYEFYETNRNDEDYKFFKRFFNVRQLHDIGVIEHLEKELNHPEAIFLFGSAAKGEDVEKSDFDIFVLASAKKDIDMEEYSRQLKREIRLIVMDKKEFERAREKNPELVNNIVNGINLRGFLEVV